MNTRPHLNKNFSGKLNSFSAGSHSHKKIFNFSLENNYSETTCSRLTFKMRPESTLPTLFPPKILKLYSNSPDCYSLIKKAKIHPIMKSNLLTHSHHSNLHSKPTHKMLFPKTNKSTLLTRLIKSFKNSKMKPNSLKSLKENSTKSTHMSTTIWRNTATPPTIRSPAKSKRSTLYFTFDNPLLSLETQETKNLFLSNYSPTFTKKSPKVKLTNNI